jgi:hypothetical protein
LRSTAVASAVGEAEEVASGASTGEPPERSSIVMGEPFVEKQLTQP